MLFLCLKIFIARIIDVSLNTIKTLFIVKGNKIISSLISFIEILIWFYAAKSALLSNVTSPMLIISYALGYACGTFIGILINEILVSGFYHIEVITEKICLNDINDLKKIGFGVSSIKMENNKTMLIIEIKKKRYKECINLLKKLDPSSFIIINETKIIHNGFIK